LKDDLLLRLKKIYLALQRVDSFQCTSQDIADNVPDKSLSPANIRKLLNMFNITDSNKKPKGYDTEELKEKILSLFQSLPDYQKEVLFSNILGGSL